MISVFIGMFLATVGMDEIYGAVRFTFGSRIMETGINFTTVLIGLFAIGEVLDQLSVKNKGEGEIIRTRPKTTLPALREIWALRNTLLRGLGIGTVIGAIPGTGATVASFVSYGVEKQVSKTSGKIRHRVLGGAGRLGDLDQRLDGRRHDPPARPSAYPAAGPRRS